MSEPFYTAQAQIDKVEGVHRRARLQMGTTFDCGVHGAIKEHFRLHDAEDLPLPVDYVAAAVGT